MCKGSLYLPPKTEPSVFLVLSGHVTCLRLERRYRPGEAFVSGRSEVLVGNGQFWRVTAQLELVGSLCDLSAQLFYKDAATAAHAARVARLARATGRQLGLAGERLEQLSLAAYLHDLGKLSLPTTMLRTPEKLTLGEWEKMKKHPDEGARLLGATLLAPQSISTVIAQHHERFNGSGYPLGLQKGETKLESYVVAVADTYDAMTYNRPYRRACSPAKALAELRRFSGVLYPEAVVTAFETVTRPCSLQAAR